MKKSSLLLLSTAALMTLASCGKNNGTHKNSSGDTPVTSLNPTSSQSGEPTITVQEALDRALAADYRNMTVYSGALANEFETGEYELYYNDYQIVYTEDYTQYFHDYQGESYQYFKATEKGEVSGWLKEGYNGAEVGLGNMNSLDIREVIAAIGKYKSKVRYMEGTFYILDEAAVQDIVDESYAWAYDVSIDTIFFTIDPESLTFEKIGGFDVDIRGSVNS